MAKNGVEDFTIVDGKWEYRNREDQTILRPGVMVVGSQNVVTNTSGRLQLVKGYKLDGDASTVNAAITGWYDFDTTTGYRRNLRTYTDPTSGNGVIQMRYEDSAGTVSWITLGTPSHTLASGNCIFTDFYDYTTEKINLCLFADGSNSLNVWSGGVTTFASCTANTITKEGTTTWAEEGFMTASSRTITISGVEYTYTGGTGTTTLTGVAPDPTGAGIAAGTPIVQSVDAFSTGAMTSNPLPKIDLVANLRNQIFTADYNLRTVYVSAVNSYMNYAFTANRLPAEGALFTLDGNPSALIPQEDAMYLSTNNNQWYKTSFALSSDNSKEAFSIERLKTAPNQGAKHQNLTAKDKNNVVFISQEPVLTTIGRVEGVIATPQMGDISYPIINDMNAYDFTGGAVKYYKNFVIFSVPDRGLIRIYNQTDPTRKYWESPVTYPITGFYEIDGELYGHSAYSVESYKLFEGYNFNGSPIPALAAFSYMNFGTRTTTKGFNEIFVEGYINQNTILNVGAKKEIDGCSSDTSFEIDGTSRIVCSGGSNAPLGKEAIGKDPFGGDLSEATLLPPKFRVIKTMPITPYFYEVQFSLYNVGVDQQWEIIGFGCKILPTNDLNNKIKQ
jgi:hypothetical protein